MSLINQHLTTFLLTFWIGRAKRVAEPPGGGTNGKSTFCCLTLQPTTTATDGLLGQDGSLQDPAQKTADISNWFRSKGLLEDGADTVRTVRRKTNCLPSSQIVLNPGCFYHWTGRPVSSVS
jgi:hypothetical protein